MFEFSWQDVAWCQSLFEAMRAQLVCANPATLQNERRDAHILDLVYEQSRLRCEKGLHSCTQAAVAACDGIHLAFSKSTPLRSVLLKLEGAGDELGVVYRSPSGDPFIAAGAGVPGERLKQPLMPGELEDRESSKLLLDASKRVLRSQFDEDGWPKGLLNRVSFCETRKGALLGEVYVCLPLVPDLHDFPTITESTRQVLFPLRTGRTTSAC